MDSDRLPDGQEYLGGTMDLEKFKTGYLVPCGNASHPENDNPSFIERRNFIHWLLV